MFLTRLVYTSTVAEHFSPLDIAEILEVARRNNSKVDVTGMLCFNNNYFLQCLEGPRTNVNKLYLNISGDPRHTDVILLNYEEITIREFSEWSMGYLPESSFSTPINLKFSRSSEFNPYEMLGESAYKLMLALRDTSPSV